MSPNRRWVSFHFYIIIKEWEHWIKQLWTYALLPGWYDFHTEFAENEKINPKRSAIAYTGGFFSSLYSIHHFIHYRLDFDRIVSCCVTVATTVLVLRDTNVCLCQPKGERKTNIWRNEEKKNNGTQIVCMSAQEMYLIRSLSTKSYVTHAEPLSVS